MTEELNEVPRTTPDFATEAATKLAELFPEVAADGKINLDTLKTILDIDVEDGRERFGLAWPGKAQAIRAAQTPTTATLEPDKKNSVDWDATQNVFIEGDNLEVLKVLQKHYYGQIKMIYIDPPYNTGKDFVYSDDYADSIGSYLELTRQTDEGGKLSTNSESTGRFQLQLAQHDVPAPQTRAESFNGKWIHCNFYWRRRDPELNTDCGRDIR